MSKPKRILLLIETSKAYGRSLLEGIGRYAMAHGAWSMYFEERSLETRAPAWMHDWQGDGIIFRSYSRSLVKCVCTSGIPAVDTNIAIRSHGCPLVYVDDAAVARMASEHFLNRGFVHFAFCAVREAPWVDQRRRAFVSHLRGLGYNCDCVSIKSKPGRSGWSGQRQQLADWARTLPKPVAVLAANDVCGARLIDACRYAGVAIPEELAVLGVDNDTILGALTSPPMSSIDLNTVQVGYKAAALLDQLMAGAPAPATPVLVPPSGVMARQSTDILAVDDPEVATALTFIRHHASDGIGVVDVLRHIQVSRKTLERRFAQVLGRSPKDEIDRVRVEHVKRLLVLTNYVLAEIAERTGFKTASHMSVLFKRHVGVSPSAFREQSRR